MADIPGIKGLRLLAQQPVPVLDLVKMAIAEPRRLPKRFALELQFEDGGIINVPLEQRVYDDIRRKLLSQEGIAIEERVAARGALAAAGATKPVTEEILPLDASGKDVYDALRRVADPPAASDLDHPALPAKKEPSDGRT